MPVDFNLIPDDDINNIKGGLDKVRQGSLDKETHVNLMSSMNNLSSSINSMLGLFREAAEDMKLDEHDSMLVADKLEPLINKVDKLLEQNEKLAKGIVAIADMVEEMKNSRSQAYIPAQQLQPRIRPQSMPAMQQQTARPLPRMPELPPDQNKKPLFDLNFK